MPVTLAKIASNTASVTFPYSGETVTVEYFPGLVTEKTLARIQALAQGDVTTMEADFESFNETLTHLIKSWDVYEDTEETIMYPLEPARLAELPIFFRMKVIESIMEDIRPEALAPQA